MTKIIPFKALRPVRDKAHLVATRPYYSYKKNVLEAKLEDNPYTFLHIINPEFGSNIKTEPNSPERFKLVTEKYGEFIRDGILVQDNNPHVYLYRQTKENHQFVGVIAGASIEEYEQDLIKKHEATLTSREEMFVDYLDIVGYNAEPVLLSYPHNDSLESLIDDYTQDRPEYEFSTTDKIKHELWVLDESKTNEISSAFTSLKASYIADGHHRSASSSGLLKRRMQAEKTNYLNENYFLAFFIDENRLKILEFNRLVKTLNGLSEVDFLNRLEKSFSIKELTNAAKPSHEHQLTMCLNGKWFELNCRKDIVEENHPVNCLDAEILTRYVLDPVLGIKDLKTDNNIEFVSGTESLDTFETTISQGEFHVGFVLFPVSMEQVKKVADNKMIMPPKSTWVEPKLRSGLTIYHINE
jgi:uncharacterized protein (DUF1015 family)